MGNILIMVGIVTVILGLVWKAGGIPKLPGDIVIHRENFSFYFPIASSVIISIVITLLLNLML